MGLPLWLAGTHNSMITQLMAADHFAYVARGCLSCGRRSTQSLLEELPRAWPPLARGCLSCGRCSKETLVEELRRAWPPLARGCLSCGRRSTQSLLYEPPAGPRLPFVWHAGTVHRASWLPFVWQAQYTELPGQAAARVATAGLRMPFVSLITHHSSLHHFFFARRPFML